MRMMTWGLCLVLSVLSVPLSVSAQGQKRQLRETMTNETVIELAKMGLGDAIIIEKIRQSERAFDTSVAGLRQLKAARISEALIKEMLGAQPNAPQTDEGGTSARATTNPAVTARGAIPALQPGIYLNDGGSLKEIYPTTYTGTKAGGFFGTALTYGIKKSKMRAKVRGASANLVTSQKRPEFYFYFDPSLAGDNMAMAGFLVLGASSPGEFVMVRMERKENSRETVIGEFNAFGASSGTRDKDMRDFAFENVRQGVFRVVPKADLAPGEYCFFYAGTPRGLGFAGGKVFDFSVIP
jgi:hypothetical protein